MNPVLRIGLTGGIGSGKSTACAIFEALGVPVIDADRIAHQLVQGRGPALAAVHAAFGAKVITDNGDLDRHYLRELVFNDSQARKKLESILHPLIFDEIRKQLALVDHPYCIISIPLLVETDAMDKVDRILVIDATEDRRIARAIRRDGGTEQTIKNIINSQATREQRLAVADDVIQNDDDIESLKAQISELHKKYYCMANNDYKKPAESGLK